MENRPLRLGRRLVLLVLCGLVLAAAWGMAQFPALLELLYAQRAGAWIARGLSLATGPLPLALSEIALAGVVLYFAVPFVVATGRVLTRRRGPVNAVVSGVLRVVTFTVVVTTAFYVAWGLNYARTPLPTRLGWPTLAPVHDESAHEAETAEIVALTRQLVDATNTAYRAYARTDDLGRPSAIPGGAASLDAALDPAFERLQSRLALEPAFAQPRGRAKPITASVVMSHLRLGGFYFPWTGEANYNRLQPDATLPHVIAHEKAHQRGIAPEDEANFIGYLACATSDDPYVQYAGFLFAQSQMLNELASRVSPERREIVRRRVPGVQRDVEAIRAFWAQYEGQAARVSAAVNDRYLRSQGESRGIAAYAASQSLIVQFARQNGGGAVPVR
jgi:hypothetical protein